jgi:hypothetical protein
MWTVDQLAAEAEEKYDGDSWRERDASAAAASARSRCTRRQMAGIT